MRKKLKKIEPFNPKSKLENSKQTNQQHLQKQSSTHVDKHMTSVILSLSIRTRLKIQRKFIHQKDNRNQEGVYSKHTWKHFLLVRKSPLVFVFPDFSHWYFSCFLPLPLKTSLSTLLTIKESSPFFFPLSRISISLPS